MVPRNSSSNDPFYDCSPVLDTNYIEIDWFVPKEGTAVFLQALTRFRFRFLTKNIIGWFSTSASEEQCSERYYYCIGHEPRAAVETAGSVTGKGRRKKRKRDRSSVRETASKGRPTRGLVGCVAWRGVAWRRVRRKPERPSAFLRTVVHVYEYELRRGL